MQAEKLTALNLTATNENLNFDSWTGEGREEQGSSNSAPSSQEQLKSLFPLYLHKSLTSVKKSQFSWLVTSGVREEIWKKLPVFLHYGVTFRDSEYETYEKEILNHENDRGNKLYFYYLKFLCVVKVHI